MTILYNARIANLPRTDRKGNLICCVDLPMREIYENTPKNSNARLKDAGQNVKTDESGYPALVRVNKSIITPGHDGVGSDV